MALGFTQADLDEGWKLFNESSRVQLKVEPATPVVEQNVIISVDGWENRWFPIADATLARHYPAVHHKLFLNLSQTEGPGVIVTVRTFLERFESLGSTAEYGPDSKAAKRLLEKRGFTRPSSTRRARCLRWL